MKKGKVLIIRSVSIQLLDKLLPIITKKFGNSVDYLLLTHSHSVKRVKKYRNIDKIIEYKKKGDFNIFSIPKEIKKMFFDYILIPVSNFSGAGFLNVLIMTLLLRTKNIYIINSKGEIKKISKGKILIKSFFSFIYAIISVFLTILLLPFVFMFLFVNLVFYRE